MHSTFYMALFVQKVLKNQSYILLPLRYSVCLGFFLLLFVTFLSFRYMLYIQYSNLNFIFQFILFCYTHFIFISCMILCVHKYLPTYLYLYLPTYQYQITQKLQCSVSSDVSNKFLAYNTIQYNPIYYNTLQYNRIQ